MDEEKMEKPSYWAVIPAKVRYDDRLTDGAKLLYAEISSLTDLAGYCFATNAYFQDLYSISERTVQGYLKSLKDCGYIRIVNGKGGAGKRQIYAGINPLAMNPAEICGVTPQNFAPNPAEICGDNKKYNNKYNNPPKAPQGAGADYVPKSAPDWKPERFTRFWKFYPLHTSKQAAIRAWDKLRPSDELLVVIGKALKRQIAEKNRRGDEWKMYASTYLNNARWTDETDDPEAEPEGIIIDEEDLPEWT